MAFIDEMEAYEFFMNNIGIQNYSQLLKELVSRVTKPSILIGFSVGATTIWRISENIDSDLIRHSFCFYSSQIRNYTSVNPCIATEVIFPRLEPKFSVPEISGLLAKKKNVKVHTIPYLHGFMNKLSKNFSQDGYREYTKWLGSSIR
ncbi:hypothetical protein [Dethiosulfatarculus sandiegensis]|uniref:Dienelactone hydrolase domain-containing protein n=1 Tax=Dethiosulfatarculus sandiegensis TaxID=1429043 RepID=A0A0D2JS52_9BACT|nr:hypothetical protein [Dethiosulfatarculus sandiegensis]KIX12345.1 hypothetical protein X474_21040 [Dethiosulfatarculus sandiegensis]